MYSFAHCEYGDIFFICVIEIFHYKPFQVVQQKKKNQFGNCKGGWETEMGENSFLMAKFSL